MPPLVEYHNGDTFEWSTMLEFILEAEEAQLWITPGPYKGRLGWTRVRFTIPLMYYKKKKKKPHSGCKWSPDSPKNNQVQS